MTDLQIRPEEVVEDEFFECYRCRGTGVDPMISLESVACDECDGTGHLEIEFYDDDEWDYPSAYMEDVEELLDTRY